MDGFNFQYNKEWTLFKKVAILDFESICVPSEELKPTETITWIGKHESGSSDREAWIGKHISVNSIKRTWQSHIFVWQGSRNPHNWFCGKLGIVGGKNKSRNAFKNSLKIESNIKTRPHTIFSILNEGVFIKSEAREYIEECIEDEEETFSGFKTNQLIVLMQHLERHTNTLTIFGFNGGRYDIIE